MSRSRFFKWLITLLMSLSLLGSQVIPAAAEGTAFDNYIAAVQKLEQYANTFANGNRSTALLCVTNYIRTSRSTYTTDKWKMAAGDTNTAFIEYVSSFNDEAVNSLRTIDTLTLPNGEVTDIVHMFASLNMSLYSPIIGATFPYSFYPQLPSNLVDFSGWAGDLSQMAENSKSAYLEDYNSVLGDNSLGFGTEDMFGDLDGYYLYKQLTSDTGSSISGLMSSYFTEDLSNKTRASYFVSARFPGKSTFEELTQAITSDYSSNLAFTVMGTQVDATKAASVCGAFAWFLYQHMQETTLNNLSCTTINLGQTLSASSISGTASINGVEIPGTFTWKETDETPQQSGGYAVVFTPDDTFRYDRTAGVLQVEVKQPSTEIELTINGSAVSCEMSHTELFNALTANQQDLVKFSESKLIMEISDITGSSDGLIPAYAEAKKLNTARVVDVNLYLNVNGESEQIHEVGSPISFRVDITDEPVLDASKYNRTYHVVTDHGGNVSELPVKVVKDGSRKYALIESRLYSGFGILYEDVKKESAADSKTVKTVITCQDAGYPLSYEWNESLKACTVNGQSRFAVPDTSEK